MPQIIKDNLEKARRAEPDTGKDFMKLAGAIEGPRDLSQRKGILTK